MVQQIIILSVQGFLFFFGSLGFYFFLDVQVEIIEEDSVLLMYIFFAVIKEFLVMDLLVFNQLKKSKIKKVFVKVIIKIIIVVYLVLFVNVIIMNKFKIILQV